MPSIESQPLNQVQMAPLPAANGTNNSLTTTETAYKPQEQMSMDSGLRGGGLGESCLQGACMGCGFGCGEECMNECCSSLCN